MASDSKQRRVSFRKRLYRLRAAFIQQDPGLLRLQATGRIMATLSAVIVALLYLTDLLELPVQSMLLATSAAAYLSLFIRDELRADRIRTTFLSSLSIIAAVAPGVWLAPYGIAAAPLLCALVLVSFAMAAVGTRATTVGLAGTWMYGFSLYFQPPMGHTLTYLLAVGFGCGVTMLIRFVIWRDDRSLERKRLLRIYGMAMYDFIDALMARSNARRRTYAFNRMHNRVFPIESALLRRSDIPDRLYETLLRFRLGIEGVGLRIKEFRPEDLERLRQDLLLFPPEISRTENAAERSARADEGAPLPAEAHPLMKRLRLRMLRIGVLSHKSSSGLARISTRSQPVSDDSTWRDRLPRVLPKALQVTLAVSLAVLFGSMLSTDRWLWAFLAALFMYVGNESAGQILTRGWSNVVGSIIGVGIGLLVTSLVQGNMAVELTAIFCFLFIGIYATPVNYAFFAAGVTATLGLLQSMSGGEVPSILELRFIEVIIGAGVGVLVAYIVSPLQARTHVRRSVAALLVSLCRLLEHSAAGEQRSMHEKLNLFRLAIAPGRLGFMPQVRHAITRRTGQLMAVVHYVELYDYLRHLAAADLEESTAASDTDRASAESGAPFATRGEDEVQRRRLVLQMEELAAALTANRAPVNSLEPTSALPQVTESARSGIDPDAFKAALDRLELALYELIEDVAKRN
ncbi:FUSC family protein [Allohahella marinimesophila]|uniref:FUSC family protein n=1 Tax=Allohahella marinimesophila TaxID=1054972 RepID=A0ABP7PIP0_9GAMM